MGHVDEYFNMLRFVFLLNSSLKTKDNMNAMCTVPSNKLMIETGKWFSVILFLKYESTVNMSYKWYVRNTLEIDLRYIFAFGYRLSVVRDQTNTCRIRIYQNKLPDKKERKMGERKLCKNTE